MISRPFLTAPDTARLDIRGSRDPLGIAVLWSHVGRHVVGNLTTASSSVRGFTSTMLGYHFAELLAPAGRDREAFRLKAFLKFEQLCGYARWRYNDDGNLRGILEVRRRLADGKPLTISAESVGQILSNQKVYGLWGLYSVPSKASGLISENLSVTPDADVFLRTEALAVLHKSWNGASSRIAAILNADRTNVQPTGKDEKLFRALAAALATRYSASDKKFYRRHLITGEGGKCALQATFAAMLESLLPRAAEFDLASLKLIIREADDRKQETLAARLRDIQHLEAVQVPMAALFGFAQARDGATVNDVVKDVGNRWGKGLAHINAQAIGELQTDIAAVFGNADTGTRFYEFASALKSGDYRRAIELVLAHNEFVMRERGGAAPWIVVHNGKLDVRYRDANVEELPTPQELGNAWRNSFYINPLKSVIDQLRAA